MAGRTLEDAWREIDRQKAKLTLLTRQVGRKPRSHLGEFTCPASAGELAISGCGFTPKLVHFFVTAANSTSAIHNGWGFSSDCQDGLMMFSHGIRGTAAGPTMARNRATTRCILLPDGSGGSSVSASMLSFDGDGFTLDFVDTSTSFDVYWLAVG